MVTLFVVSVKRAAIYLLLSFVSLIVLLVCELLIECAEKYGIPHISTGDIFRANYLLGENYSIYETVIHGKALGRQLGIPTINQNIQNKQFILKNGIYATVCTLDGAKYYGVTNVGLRPTVDENGHKNIETHIIDFDKDCYGKNVKIEFISRIRDEIKFNSVDELKLQIQRDIKATKDFFINH